MLYIYQKLLESLLNFRHNLYFTSCIARPNEPCEFNYTELRRREKYYQQIVEGSKFHLRFLCNVKILWSSIFQPARSRNDCCLLLEKKTLSFLM